MSASNGDGRIDTAMDQKDWIDMQLPKEVLVDGGKLAHHFRTLSQDEPAENKRKVLEHLDDIKKAPYKEIPAGVFSGSHIDRIRLFCSSKDGELNDLKKTFETSAPSSALRELHLQEIPEAVTQHQISSYQLQYCFEKHIQLLAQWVVEPRNKVKKERGQYVVNSHEPAIFPEKLFSLASCRLQLEMLSSFRKMNPGFFQSGTGVLIQSILDCPPYALQQIQPYTSEAAIHQSMFEFCSQVLQDVDSSPSEKFATLTLLFALGESSSRLHPLLYFAKFLLFEPLTTTYPDIVFKDKALELLRRMESFRVKFTLGAISSSVLKRLRVNGGENWHSYAIATNGHYIYALTNQGLLKIGTGYHGTMMGNIYLTLPVAEISEWIGWDITKPEERQYAAKLVWIQSQIYLWFIWKDEGEKNTSLLFLLDDSTLEMVARECEDLQTNGFIESAEHISLCTDGLHLIAVSHSSNEISIQRRDPMMVWECIRTDTIQLGSQHEDVQRFFKNNSNSNFYTNGYELVGAVSDGKLIKQIAIDISEDSDKIWKYSEFECNIEIKATCFDLLNNVIWTASTEEVSCHPNTGNRVRFHSRYELHPELEQEMSSDLTSRSVAFRILRHMETIVDEYLPEDISQMDVQDQKTNVPFCVDNNPSTFNSLISMVTILSNNSASLAPWQEFVLTVCLKLLTLNTLHWLGTKDKEIADVIIQGGLPTILQSLFNSIYQNRIVKSARILYVLILDVIHPDVKSQLKLLVTYLEQYHTKILSTEVIPLVELLVDRLASKSKVLNLVNEGTAVSDDGPQWLQQILQIYVDCVSEKIQGGESMTAIEIKLTQFLYSVLQGHLGGCQSRIVSRTVLFKAFGLILRACTRLCTLEGSNLVETLKKTILGEVVGPFFGYFQAILSLADDSNDAVDMLMIKEAVESSVGFLKELQRLIKTIPTDDREEVVDVQFVGKSSVTMESPHEYSNDMHEIKELRLDGATSMTITFDERTRTEQNYDYVTFYNDKSYTTYYGAEKYSGRDSSYNWPGMASNPPLVINSDHCYVLFHSDGSTTDWGYKFTAIANISESNSSLRLHWLTSIEDRVMSWLMSIINLGSKWTPVDGLEVDQLRYLENELLHGGIDTKDHDEVSSFLIDMIDLEVPDTPATNVARILKKHTIQDQGSIAHINKAVRAVAAAILHHNMWGMDAYALGQGLRNDPTPSLLKAWKNAQKMRNWFDLGDAQRVTENVEEPGPSKPKLSRQPSAYVGASEDALRTLCSNVEERARFLLSLAPASFSLANAEDPVNAKKRWSLLAQYGTALRKGDNPASILERWHSLVDEVGAATELKRMLLYRKNSAGRHQGNHAKTITELVLEFVQSDVIVADIRCAVSYRDRRAQHRLMALSIVNVTLSLECNPRLEQNLVECFIKWIVEMDPNRVHFLANLSGCTIAHRNTLRELYSICLVSFSTILKSSMHDGLVVAVLKAISMDYDVKDSDILYKSEIIPVIFKLLTSPKEDVRLTAQSTARTLLERFMTKEKHANIQKQLCTAVQHHLDRVHQLEGAGINLQLQGFYTTTELAFNAMSFWLYLPSIKRRQLRLGDEVVTGPQWNDVARSTGEVIGIHDKEVSVAWTAFGSEKATKGFHKYDPSKDILEIVPIDQDMSGQIVFKTNSTPTPWSEISLQLTREYTIEASVSGGIGQAFTIKSEEKFPFDTWKYVTFGRDDENLKLIVHDHCKTTQELDDSLKSNDISNVTHLLESTHPFHGQPEQWSTFPITIPDATSVRIEFDSQTNLTHGSNYIAIYADETMDCIYGENMYNQAFGNFPGVGGNEMLEIPSGKFVVGLFTEDSHEIWGFRIIIHAVSRLSSSTSTSTESIYYLGEPPARVKKMKPAHCYIDGFSLHEYSEEIPSIPTNVVATDSITTAAHALSLVETCLSSQNEYAIQTLCSNISLDQILHMAFETSLPIFLRSIATTVASHIIGKHVVDFNAGEIYVNKAFNYLAYTLNSWHQVNTQPRQMSSSSAFWLATSYANFLRACSKQTHLQPILSTLIFQCLYDLNNFGPIFAALAVLGGIFDGIFIGSRIKCLKKKDSLEVGTVIGFAMASTEKYADILLDMDMTRVERVSLDKIDRDENLPPYLSTLYEGVSGELPALVDLMQRLEAQNSIPLWNIQARLLKAIHLLCRANPTSSTIPLIRPALMDLAIQKFDGENLGVKSSLHTYESAHPYADSVDIYEYISVKNASSLKITFDTQTRTEHECDYLIFYKDESHAEHWGEERYSGRDGSENFPGLGGNAPLEIPADHFVLYFHTDSSNSDWGYKFTVEATYNDVAPSNFTLDELNQRMYHLSEILLEKGQPHGDSTQLADYCHKSKSNWVEKDTKGICPAYMQAEAITRWTAKSSAIKLYQDANESGEPVGNLNQGDELMLVEYMVDWLHVKNDNVDGWCRRADMQYMEPKLCTSYIHCSARFRGWESIYQTQPKPEELITTKRDRLDNFESHFKTETVEFTSPNTTTDSLVRDFSKCISIQYAKLCLRSCVELGLAANDMVVEDFMNLAKLFVHEEDSMSENLSNHLKKLVIDPHFAKDIVAICSSTVAELLNGLPRNHRMAERTIQDMERDSFVTIEFPGAKLIRLVFNKETHCHESAEFVQIYDRERVVKKIHGAKGDNWPGVSGSDALDVETDKLTVQFEYLEDHDVSRLIQFTAYGIYEDSSDEETSPPSNDDIQTLRLACWVFSGVARTKSLLGHHISIILDLTFQLYQMFPQQVQLDVIDVWAALLLDSTIFKELTSYQIHTWFKYLKNKLWQQNASEIRSKSILLQRLIQVMIDLEFKFESYLLSCESQVNTFDAVKVQGNLPAITIDQVGNESTIALNIDQETLVVTDEGVSDGLCAWDFVLKKFQTNFVIGATNDKNELAVCWPSHIAVEVNDILTLEVDMHLKYITFKRNSATVETVPINKQTTKIYPTIKFFSRGDEVIVKRQAPLLPFRYHIGQGPKFYTKIISVVKQLRGFNSPDALRSLKLTQLEGVVNATGASKLLAFVDPKSTLEPQQDLQLESSSQCVLLNSMNSLIQVPDHVKPSSNTRNELILKQVVRGFDWEYENDDGRAGNLGVIVSQESWHGEPFTAVRVLWLHNNETKVYRYGYLGYYDVDIVPHAADTHGLMFNGNILKSSIVEKAKPPSFVGSLNFNGNQVVEIPGLASLHKDFTIQLWVRLNRIETNCLFEISSTNSTWWMALTHTSSGKLAFSTFHEREESFSLPYSFKQDQWTRIEICACGSMIAIHVDGEMLGHQRLITKSKFETSTSILRLGGHHDTNLYKRFVGQIYGVKLWDSPLHLKSYVDFFANDERNLAEECSSFDELHALSYEASSPTQVPKEASLLAQKLSSMLFTNNGMHFATVRPRNLGILSPISNTKVYFEVTLFAATCVQVGWSFKECSPQDQTNGVGDCSLSFSINLAAQSKWHGDREHISEVPWEAGDVVGCLLDWDLGEMSFSVNGRMLEDIKFIRSGGDGATHEVNSPTPSMLGGLWGDEDDAEEEVAEEDNAGEGDAEEIVAREDHAEDSGNDEAVGDEEQEITQEDHVNDNDNTQPDTSFDDGNELPQNEIEEEPCEETPESTSPEKPKITIVNNSWLQHGGIFPSVSFRTGDSIRWNFGSTPLSHCPDDYVPIATALQMDEKVIEFEKFDYEDKEWQDVVTRHRIDKKKPQLLGEWICLDGQGEHIKDTSVNHHNGTIKSVSKSTWLSNVLSPSSSLPSQYTIHVHPLQWNAKSVECLPSQFEPTFIIGKQKEYLEMVRYINHVCNSRSTSLTDLLASTWSKFIPEKDSLVRWPILSDLTEKGGDLNSRFDELIRFNKCIREVLGCIELTSSSSLASQISNARGFVFSLIKHELWDVVLDKTQAATSPDMALTLNRPKASRWKKTSSDYNRFALFAQAYREMINWTPTTYLRQSNLYVVTFLGENSIDAGGPYRETLSQFCAELQSSQLPLLLPTPNGQHNVGLNRDAWVLHPNGHVQYSGMLIFLGKLLGVAIRTKYCLSLNLSQIIWKLLVQDQITLDDLEAIDILVVNSMESLRTIEQSGVTEEIFADVMLETMTTLSTDNRTVNLIENGDTIPVTFTTRDKFADLVLDYRMHEFDQVTKYLRKGLGMVVSLRLLRLFTWMELESLVCGTPEVDIDLLETCTEYSSCKATDQHVIWFWQVLREYSQEARQTFLRFVWGRSRLPRSIQEFQRGQQFKLQAFEKQPADVYLPVSHTCFFSLELPRYTSREILSTRLTYAIYNCIAIDGDTNTMQANQLGWED